MRTSMISKLPVLSFALSAALSGCSPTLSSDEQAPDGILDPSRERPASTVRGAASAPLGSGGGLAVSSDGRRALYADVDLNQVLLVDLEDKRVVRRELFPAVGMTPGRPVAAPNGGFFVATRSLGHVFAVSSDGALGQRTPVCAEPRGLALQGGGPLWVACANGDVMRLRTDTLAVEQIVRLPIDDLREIVVQKDAIFVSSFRQPTLVTLGLDGALLSTRRLPTYTGTSASKIPYAAQALFRMIPVGEGVAVSYQQATVIQGVLPMEYYRAPLPLLPFITRFEKSGELAAGQPADGAILPIDVAKTEDGKKLALISAGNIPLQDTNLSTDAAILARAPIYVTALGAEGRLGALVPVTPIRGNKRPLKPVAIAAVHGDELVVAVRDPRALLVINTKGEVKSEILFGGAATPADPGSDLFHAGNLRGLACASCHLEGGDDGHLWFTPLMKSLRTMSLLGTGVGKKHFGWIGQHETLTETVSSDMERFGTKVSDLLAKKTEEWLLGQPARWAPAVYQNDRQAAARGAVVFQSSGCQNCHVTAGLGTGELKRIGTKDLAVPSLRSLAQRGPYRHDGRAADLPAVFSDPSDSAHFIATPSSRDDLSTYLKTGDAP